MSPDNPAARPRRDEFLSQEDLDLQNLTDDELDAWWNLWLEIAQTSNEEDRYEYSHGVFRRHPSALHLKL